MNSSNLNLYWFLSVLHDQSLGGDYYRIVSYTATDPLELKHPTMVGGV